MIFSRDLTRSIRLLPTHQLPSLHTNLPMRNRRPPPAIVGNNEIFCGSYNNEKSNRAAAECESPKTGCNDAASLSESISILETKIPTASASFSPEEELEIKIIMIEISPTNSAVRIRSNVTAMRWGMRRILERFWDEVAGRGEGVGGENLGDE